MSRMSRVGVSGVLAVCAAWLASTGVPAQQPVPARPNVIVVLVDDLGWADTSPYGSAFHDTPAIDRLARDGVRFTTFYAAGSVCSPTRASLWTGKYPARLGITDWIGGDDTGVVQPPPNRGQLPLEEITIGEAFRDAGYATGYVGKWHLGTGPFMPGAQGFQWTRAVNNAGQPTRYFFPYRDAKPQPTDVPDLDEGRDGDYLTDTVTDEAIGFIDRHQSAPFFLVLAHYAVHTPLQAKAELTSKYEQKAAGLFKGSESPRRAEGEAFTKLRQDHPTYAAMLESTDESVGRIRERLDALHLAERTIVVFVSDNGGLSTIASARANMPTSNEPLRAGKGWLYEGGIRVPFIVAWPGRIAGGRTEATPGISTDLYPTLLDLAGIAPRPKQHLDGVSLAQVIRGTGRVTRDTIYWHFPHYHGSGSRPSSAIRAGNWKLVEWLETGKTELYDLASDPSELRDLASSDPQRAAALRTRLSAWRQAVGARMPLKKPAAGGSGMIGEASILQ